MNGSSRSERRIQRVQQQIVPTRPRRCRCRERTVPASVKRLTAKRIMSRTVLAQFGLVQTWGRRQVRLVGGYGGRCWTAAAARRSPTHSSILWIVALTGPISYDLRADVGDEAPIRGAPVVSLGLGQQRHGLRRVRNRQVALAGQGRSGAERQAIEVVQTVSGQNFIDGSLKAFGVLAVEAEVELDIDVPGMTLLAPVPP